MIFRVLIVSVLADFSYICLKISEPIIMTAFLISLAVLIGGYLIYGRVAERVFGADPARATPAVTMADGVDYVPCRRGKFF